ncbi:MAG TPA: three component ABC system middle component [Pirellulales bacterium]|nr:three component ABC system middle component [Pirellulales bacterium]
MLPDWDSRPQDIAALLNPAFDGLLLHRAVAGYQQEASMGAPFPVMFLFLPFILHEPTRQRLPAKVTTHLATWLQDERDAVLGFADRTADLVPYTQEAILFLTNHGLLDFDGDERCVLGKARFKNGVGNLTSSSAEVKECHKAALAVGRWLALSGNPTTLYSLMGIRP